MTDRTNTRTETRITRRQAVKGFAGVAGAISLSGLLDAPIAGAAKLASTASSGKIPSLTWAIQGEIPSLDITTGFVSYAQEVMSLGLEGLVGLNDDLTLKPVLAESWSQPDPLHYVYKLRKGVKFWDGSPLTAEDVQYSLARHLDPKVGSQLGSFYANVKSVEISGAHQITVKMNSRDPTFQYIPVLSYIIPKALALSLGKQLGAPGSKVNTLGTGPYVITAFDASTGVQVQANPKYWGSKPNVQSAKLQIITDPQTAYLGLQSGSIDGTDNYPFDLAHNYDTLTSVKTQYSQALGSVFIALNVTMAPFDDLHARRALAHAVDGAGFVKAFLDGHGQVAKAVAPQAQWASAASTSETAALYAKIPQYGYSMAQAKAELAKSKYPKGFTASIEYPNNVSYVGKALVSLAQSLKSIGCTLTVKEVTSNKWLDDLYANNSQMILETFFPDFPDPADYIDTLYPSANAVKNNFNAAHFKDPTVDKLLVSARKDPKAARAKALAKVLEISGEELPYVPMWWQGTPLALSTKYSYAGFGAGYYLQPWLAGIGAS